jgi:hypothetical protein
MGCYYWRKRVNNIRRFTYLFAGKRPKPASSQKTNRKVSPDRITGLEKMKIGLVSLRLFIFCTGGVCNGKSEEDVALLDNYFIGLLFTSDTD